MIIHNFNIFRAVFAPDETDAPLVIDPYRMLPRPVSLQGFKPVGRRYPQIVQSMGSLKHGNLSHRNPEQI